ncbi:MAG TPA: hypothetical protein VMW21_02205 [Patescibacteria group bacterium]|nr:hypothetical protein [Patescibacteria group bacterium]
MLEEEEYLSLKKATEFCSYTQEYLSLRARQGKLKAVKFGRNWVTRKDWLQEYLEKTNEYNQRFNNLALETTGENEITEEKKIVLPPRNLPVENPLKLRRLVFSSVLVFTLLISGFAFGKINSILVENFAVSDIPEIFNKVKNLSDEVVAFSAELAENFDRGVAAEIENLNLKIKNSGEHLSSYVYLASVGELLEGYGQWINQSHLVVNDFIEQKLAEGYQAVNRFFCNTVKNNYLALNDFVEEKIEQAARAVAEPFVRTYRFFAFPWKMFFDKDIVFFDEAAKEELETLRQELNQLKQEGLTVKEVDRVSQIEPLKEITRETVEIDDKALANLQIRLALFETATKQELAKRIQGVNVPNYSFLSPNGASSVSTLGTITSGTWNASTIDVTYGGTGLASVPAGYTLIGDSSDSLQATSALFVALDGNVGIATTSPSYALDVYGTFRVAATSTFSGNVGIGTTGPTAKLTIDNTAIPTGSELITNGTFDSNADGWELYDCGTYNAGTKDVTVVFTGAEWYADVTTTFDVENGKTYLLTFTLSNVSGEVVYYWLDNMSQTYYPYFGSGTHTVFLESDFTGEETIWFESWSYPWREGGTWTIDDVSIKEINLPSSALEVIGFDGSTWFSTGGNISGNTALGYSTLSANTTGSYNSALGWGALGSNTTGFSNTAMGNSALYSNTTGSYNSAVGDFTLFSNTTGFSNSALGWGALSANTTGYHNSAVGDSALYFNTTGKWNSAVGYYALSANTTGLSNTAMGWGALSTNTTGKHNTAIGDSALYSNATGSYNSALGTSALYANTTGLSNTAMGWGALSTNTTGSYNLALGESALYFNTLTTSTVAVGAFAAQGSTDYSNQSGTYVGYNSGFNVQTGSDNNTFLGYQTGLANTTGANNLLLGYQAGQAFTTGSNNIVIGYNTDLPAVDSSNMLNIGNLIYAINLSNFTNPTSTVGTGYVGIGTTTPAYTLDVNGDIRGINIYGTTLYGDGSNLAGIITTETDPIWQASSTLYASLENANVFTTVNTFGNIAIPTLFTNVTEPTGFVDKTATLSFATSTYTFTITGNHDIYINGVKTTKTTASKQIADTTGIHWIYYNAAGTLSEATTHPGFDVPLIATVYWNTTLDRVLLGEERHGIIMDGMTHRTLHNTVGVRYESGLTGTFADSNATITAGIIDDEDLEHSITQQTNFNVIYKNGSANFEWDATSTAYYKLSGTDLLYNNGNATATVTTNRYVAYWIFATNDPITPIVSLMGQREDTTITNARNNNKYESLTLGILPYQEMKLLYRVILKNDGTPYEETQDLRSISNLPAGTFLATQHNALTGLEWSLSGHNDINLNINANANGFVGIGTTTPATALHVYSTDANGQLRLAYDDTKYLNIKTDSAGQTTIIGTATTTLVTTGNSNQLVLGANGNVGIGIANPAAILTVQGISSSPIFHAMASSSASALYIANNGSVGIGTANPQNQLTIYKAMSGDKYSLLSVDQMQLSQLEGGAYFGSVGLRESQWGLTNYATNWVQKTSDAPRDWKGITVSSDGMIQTAVVHDGFIYVSTDYGGTWTQKDAVRGWRHVAMSSDGKIQTAVDNDGYIYVSTNYGNTWAPKASVQKWYSVAISSDGRIQTAVIGSDGTGLIWGSTDHGNTWTQRTSTKKNFLTVAMSSDGRIQTAVVYGDCPAGGNPIWISADYGVTWMQKDLGTPGRLKAVAMSSDGKIQTAILASETGCQYGYIWGSTDYGNTWTQRTSDVSRNWKGIAMSSSGKIQTAVVDAGFTYSSTDYGVTWVQKGTALGLQRVAMSSDGKIQVAFTDQAYIFRSVADSYIIDGNVGIGTKTPLYRLDVTGSIRGTDSFVFSDGSTQTVAGTPDGFGWHVGTASFKQLKSVITEEAVSRDLFFKPDGTKMYIIGSDGDSVYEYNLSTAWDTSSSVYSQLFNVTTEETLPYGLFFKPDGTKMYIIGPQVDEVNEYDLSIPWDISSSVWLQLFSVTTEEGTPSGLFFKPDGTKMYVIGQNGVEVNEYSLSTAWNVSSAIFNQLFSVTTEETTPNGLFFKPDGTKMYIIGQQVDEVNEYSLSTPWDISTAVFNQLFSVTTEETTPEGLFFKPDGTKMYIIGSVGDEINEYDLGLYIGGNVGIGTTTPAYFLTIDAGATSTVALGVHGSAIFTGTVTQSGSLDIAERYPIDSQCQTNQNCPEGGDLVSVTENLIIEKSSVAYDSKLIGVVSESPGFILGGGLNKENSRLVALAGRVAVKVSTENGPIVIGDALTSSVQPGVAMKATKAGRVIGIALENYDGYNKDGKIMIFINPHWQGNDLNIVQNDDGKIVNIKLQQGLASFGLMVNEYGMLEVDTLKTRQLCVGSVCVTEAEFQAIFGTGRGGNGGSDGSSDDGGTSEGETSPDCDVTHLNLCSAELDCQTAGGVWDSENNVCNSKPEPQCDKEHLDLCNTKELCEGANLYWYNDVCNLEQAPEPELEPEPELKP